MTWRRMRRAAAPPSPPPPWLPLEEAFVSPRCAGRSLLVGEGRAESCGSPAIGSAADGEDGEHSIIDVHEDLHVRKWTMTIKNATNYHVL